jgi:hypothetical protein
MNRRIPLVWAALALTPLLLAAQAPAGQLGSSNVHVASHVQLSYAADIEIEQEMSRPYSYVSKGREAGFDVISLKDPNNATIVYSWHIADAELHQGGALRGSYFKIKGSGKTGDRYYYVQCFQFRAGGPDNDLGAIVFDVTGLPDASKVREVARIRVPEAPGGFHNIFLYKHSDGRVLLFSTNVAAYGSIFDMEKLIAGDAKQGLVARVPLPGNPYNNGKPTAGVDEMLARALPGWHDYYAGYDPATHQDKLYAAGAGGCHTFDITRPEEPKLLFSVAGVVGMPFCHTFTPSPDGRYAVAEVEYQYAPLRIFDLKPGQDGQTPLISKPISAWTANWMNLSHNTEVRWPYVFVSAYRDGLQVFDMSNPLRPHTVGFYDTVDEDDSPEFGGSVLGTMGGAFGVDVRNADGLIVISDGHSGFWAFRMDGFAGWNGHAVRMPNISSAQDWDNGPEGSKRTTKPVTMR